MGNLKKEASEKNECLGRLKEFLPQILEWLTIFLASEVFVKENMALRPVSNVDVGLF